MLSYLKEQAKAVIQRIYIGCARDMDIADATGPTLVIAPHPDDESLGCGAAVARLRAKGQPVRIVIVTDGSAAGNSKVIGPKEIAATRRVEAENAGIALGVPREETRFLDFRDGHTQERPEAVEAALAEQICAYAPMRIFSPFGADGHPDHRVIAAAMDRLCRKRAVTCPVYEYPIWFWTSLAVKHLFQPSKMMRLRRIKAIDFLPQKKAAIAAHKSQYEAPTDEAGWFVFPRGFIGRFLTPFELFFEKPKV